MFIFYFRQVKNMKSKLSFRGFPEEVTDFLWELRFNNNKEWFDKNRERYVQLFKEPMDAFAYEMNEMLVEKTGINTLPSVSRINRDIRFSKNKAPYRDHKWVVFKRDLGTWKNKPVIYFELGPDYYSMGTGVYEGLPQYMSAFRKKIDANTAEFERIIKKYEKGSEFELKGDMYKKRLANDKSDAVMNYYQRKSVALISDKAIDSIIYKRELLDYCLERFMYLMPITDFMSSINIEE